MVKEPRKQQHHHFNSSVVLHSIVKDISIALLINLHVSPVAFHLVKFVG